jgi:2-oxoisovalerate dehydrogenase E1 component beta subunit
MVYTALEAADELEKDGVGVDVLDLRSILPYDEEAILESVAKTGRAIVLHEATRTGGVGGEFAALIADRAFDYLDAPVKRVASIDAPVPYSPPLESFFLPNRDKVLAAARELLAY